ncbi:hypothetical protein DNTS_029962 [Danionella cerebrum]|nr:hypothetical protein DNTS_029962 [Danionella translucida]
MNRLQFQASQLHTLSESAHQRAAESDWRPSLHQNELGSSQEALHCVYVRNSDRNLMNSLLIVISHEKPSNSRTSRGRSALMVSEWSEEDVLSWLQEEGLEAVADIFTSNNIDGGELLSLTKETLSSDLHIESLGLRSKIMKKIEELKMAPVSNGTPDEFLCPITREIMKDPVIAADGYSYERDAIESWIKTKSRTSPMTNLPLQTTLLTPNRTLKMAIFRWSTSQ